MINQREEISESGHTKFFVQGLLEIASSSKCRCRFPKVLPLRMNGNRRVPTEIAHFYWFEKLKEE